MAKKTKDTKAKKDWGAIADKQPEEEAKPEKSAEKKAAEGGALEHPDYQELEAKLTAAEEKVNEYWNQVLHVKAEGENLQRRAERDVANAHKFALEKFATDLLPVIDSLERGLQIDIEGAEGLKDMHNGMELTMELFIKTLDKFGIKQVHPVGEPFNPDHHEAMTMREEPGTKPNVVLEVMQNGYLLNDRLVRPALVIVSK